MRNEDHANPEEDLTVEQWLQVRKQEALRIDPGTAEVYWTYAQSFDPYGVYPDLPDELRVVGREYFARAPGSDVWVWFGDLPAETARKLWDKDKDKLAFRAGLFDLDQ